MRRRRPQIPRSRLKLAETALRYYNCYKTIFRILGDQLVYSDGDSAPPLIMSCHIDAVLMFDSARMRAEHIEAALKTLPELDFKVLTAFYINREKGYIDRLSAELFYEERNIYRLKDRALIRFAEVYFRSSVQM